MFVRKAGFNKYVLSIVPEYHTQLFPDSILKNEQKYDLIQDVSETNSIYKIYLCWMKGTRYLKTGDKLVIYRTSDFQGPAKYRMFVHLFVQLVRSRPSKTLKMKMLL